MNLEHNFEGQDFRPRAPRIDVQYEVVVRVDANEIPATIVNLSGCGFGLHASAALEAGREVTLLARRHTARAVIRWARGNHAGGLFAEPVAL